MATSGTTSTGTNTTNSIRPVLRNFPISRSLLEESNLPMSLIVIPLENEDSIDEFAMLTGISKCMHCGAPHAHPNTHFVGKQKTSTDGDDDDEHTMLLCYLCGRTTTTTTTHHHHPTTTTTEEGDNRHNNNSTRRQTTTIQASQQVFGLPLRLWTDHLHPYSPQSSLLYEIPALQCPPLWYIVLDGTCNERNYWKTISEILSDIWNDNDNNLPPHLHIAIFMAQSSDDTIAMFDLNSPIPHVQTFHYNNNNQDDDDDDDSNYDLWERILLAAVPADTPHIGTALRSLMDYQPPPQQQQQPQLQQHQSQPASVSLLSSLPLLLQALRELAIPAGQRGHAAVPPHPQPQQGGGGPGGADQLEAQSQLLPYAGAKITYLLTHRVNISGNQQLPLSEEGEEGQPHQPSQLPPLQQSSPPPSGTAATYRRRPPYDTGGDTISGSTRGSTIGCWSGHVMADSDEPGERFQTNILRNNNNKWQMMAELTPQALQERYRPPKNIDDVYAELGKQCADASVGVDLLLLYNDKTMTTGGGEDDDGGGDIMDVEEEDAVDFGLVLFQALSHRSGAPSPVILAWQQTDRLRRELLSRAPHNENCVFGAELRIRLSPGFLVDNSMILPDDTTGGAPQVALQCYQEGLIGSASAVGESAQLWRMGSTTSHMAFGIDLAVSNNVQDRFFVDGFGEVALKPVIQTCFAYTTIVKDVDGKYKTVRQMRIASRSVPLARTTEALYDSLDTEALAVVLFHKVALASFQDGLVEAADMAKKWLQLLLTCVYRSAEERSKIQRQREEKGVSDDSRYFVASERLLDLDGDLSAEDVLLAQGHERLRPIVLMVYLLMQCDALRPSRYSTDVKAAAMSQMSSMTPSALTRCIAPRLQLWESGKSVKEPLLDVLDLRSEAVQSAILEYSSSSDKGLIILLDTPAEIVIMDARSVNAVDEDNNNNSKKKRRKLIVGEGLKQAIEDAASSYRVRPNIVYELEDDERTLMRLVDCLVEDAPNELLGCENFSDWKAQIALQVQDELET